MIAHERTEGGGTGDQRSPGSGSGRDAPGFGGSGEPSGGGRGHGIRTEELYKRFIAKRKNLWKYDLGIDYSEFRKAFGRQSERISERYEELFETDFRFSRKNSARGNRLNPSRMVSFLSGYGDGRIFDRTLLELNDDTLKKTEILFLINKGRRIFNFELSLSAVIGLSVAAMILESHRIRFGVAGYSNSGGPRGSFQLQYYKLPWQEVAIPGLIGNLSSGWSGDTVDESPVIEKAAETFDPEARLKLMVILSDFRGRRGKINREKDLADTAFLNLQGSVSKLRQTGIVFLGAGMGPRSVAEELFPDFVSITERNFSEFPGLLARKLGEFIKKSHPDMT